MLLVPEYLPDGFSKASEREPVWGDIDLGLLEIVDSTRHLFNVIF